MSVLKYYQQELFIEEASVLQIVKEYGTPCYIYSQTKIVDNLQKYLSALRMTKNAYKIHYAVKANSNLQILKILCDLDVGFDVVSGGEITRVLTAGGNPQDIVFSGVGKTSNEIEYAINLNIFAIHVESSVELIRIQEIAQRLGKKVNIALRINPDVTTDTHAYISTGSRENKFGIEYVDALATFKLAQDLPNINIQGIACHIGSQITNLTPFVDALEQLLTLVDKLNELDIHLAYIDVGGGLGIRYHNESPPTQQEYIQAITNKLANYKLELHLEPGRSIVADAGFLVTKLEYIKETKHNNFAIVDAGMNDLMRPALYNSYHEIIPVTLHADIIEKQYSVVGPVCESGDFLGQDRMLKIKDDDLLLIKDCGAYAACMSSNYNTRARAPEILVNGATFKLIRKRETIEQLLLNEQL